MKTVEIKVTYKYVLEIDETNVTVGEYESENDLILDCATYNFGPVLPVIKDGGVKVKDCEVISID